MEEYNNKVQIVSLDEDTSEFTAKSTFDHPYPTTKIMWIPDTKGLFPDLLATSGDYLRIWRAGEPETRLECLLNNNKNSDFCAPLTSFDWNEVDPNLLGELTWLFFSILRLTSAILLTITLNFFFHNVFQAHPVSTQLVLYGA